MNPYEGCYQWSPAGWKNPPAVALGCAANAGVLTWSYPAQQLNVSFELQAGQRCVSVEINNGPSGSVTLKDLQGDPFGFVTDSGYGTRTWVINTTTPSSPLALVVHAGSNAYHEELSYTITSTPCADESSTRTTTAETTPASNVQSTPASNGQSTSATNVQSTPATIAKSTPAIDAAVESHTLLLTIFLVIAAAI